MFGNISEQVMHRVRWGVTLGWLLLIVSLFYDPITPVLTRSTNLWSPLHIDPHLCIEVQGVCEFQSPYALGAACFWGMVIPASIFVMLVFGHELWRRICPLSFLSQLPRALGWQRNLKRVDPASGRIRVELAKVKANSWLGRHYSYVQFGLLYIGLCGRILCFNADRTLLAMWILGTIAAAIAVGYYFGGKSWCQYFCPMATVQHIFAQPTGVFTQPAANPKTPITQSMCRTIKTDRREKSNCVACKSVCIDIDAEREYWASISQPQRRFIYYAYAGLVVGYFVYYYLYAGNWEYYFSGIWAYEPDQFQKLTQPGFYILGHAIAIPKFVAAPLTLGISSGMGYFLGRLLEKKYRNYLWRKQIQVSQEEVRHRLFSLITYLMFNVYFVFGGRQFIVLLPLPIQYCYNLMLSIISTIWICRVWRGSVQKSSPVPLLSKKMGAQQ